MPTVLLCCPVAPLGWRAGAAILAVLLAWAPLRAIVFGRGPHAVRRIEWAGGTDWRLTDGHGRLWPARLHPSSAGFGPWLLLVWSAPGRRRGRWRGLIDASASDPRAFRALKGRLNC